MYVILSVVGWVWAAVAWAYLLIRLKHEKQS
jgi:hypothetical protein